MRKYIIFIFLSASLAACLSRKPVANLSFSQFVKFGDQYEIKFSSDIDLQKIYLAEKGEKVVSNRLICSLDDDRDFSTKHNFQHYLRGDVRAISEEKSSSGNLFFYVSHADFHETLDNDISRKYIDEKALLQFISHTSAFACKVVMTVYSKPPYYSETMLIPTKEILKAIKPGAK